MLIGSKIIGIGAGIPESVISNTDLEKLIDTSDEWIKTRTGIKTRRIINQGESNTNLAISAAQDALGFANIDPKTIDLIVVGTSTPDFLYPSTACLVQSAIGANQAACFDLEAACSGIIYALTVAQQFIQTGFSKTVLVIGVDVHSRFLDWQDRNTCVLFGDGAGAFILQASNENHILASSLASDGSRGHLLSIPNINSNFPHEGEFKPSTVNRYLQMNGKAIYEFAVNAIPQILEEVCQKANIKMADLDYIITHQANQRIIDYVAKKLNLPKTIFLSNVADFGNTSAASIPLALWHNLKTNQIKSPSLMAFIGFGGGLTWGANIIKWNLSDSR